ncbi:MAG: acyltransferase [Devosia sp.]|uniref:acyltransferase family protein n=1 Tax=Devosia sp. 66-22 TaxID=1895753 RepID=UPI00092C6818|nr:acyltransferase [Devosia sp. 66-22]MBN9346704.1 acyltransferase [Devosia sp.]OJX52603.1 MAG: hypothetical protein BGO81_17130 [Devosia sp. 66-22]
MAARHHYQAELDGLRALAVSGVVLCHLDFPWLPGGFVGVDIFFVLSGFLITRLLTGELAETGRLGFRTFYLRRLRRLYPALLTTIAATWVVSFFLLSPHQMRDFASSAFAAVFSLANVQFYLESGYWAALANTKPLLHTWSLSVEEQFYLIWPLLLFALHRLLPRPGVVIAIVLISAASLAVSLHWLRTDDAAAFYMLPSRTFELGLGALLVWLPARCVGQPRVARAEFQYNDRLDELVPEFLSVNDIQCPGGICQFFEDGHILFQDAQHLNGRGSTLMVSRLKPLLPF